MKKFLIYLFTAMLMISCNREDNSETLSIPNSTQDQKLAKETAQINAIRSVKRFYSSQKNKHFFGVNVEPIGSQPNTYGWKFEGNAFGLNENFSFESPLEVVSLINPNPGNLDNILATSSVEIQSAISQGYVIAETVGYGYSNSNTGSPVYRYYNHSTNDHLYTKNWSELGSGGQGYTYEGIAFYAF